MKGAQMCEADVQLLQDCAAQLAVNGGTAWEKRTLTKLCLWFYVPRGPDAIQAARCRIRSAYAVHATGRGEMLWVRQAASYLLSGQFEEHTVL